MPNANWTKLTQFLNRLEHDQVTLTWQELAAIVGALPASAVQHSVWWSGDRPNTRAWRAAGFEVLAKEPGRKLTLGRVTPTLTGLDAPHNAPVSAEPARDTSSTPSIRASAQRRRDDTIEALIADFPAHVARFEASGAFPGPSLYFHTKAIQRRRTHETVASLLADDCFFEYVYAVLPAWGMHRMGAQKAKVRDFAATVESLRANATTLTELWPLRITQLSTEDAATAAALAWDVIADVRVSASDTQIVAGSKTLHHLLPDLIPPIDRQYTFRFFTGQKAVPHGDRAALLLWIPLFAQIGGACQDDIAAAMGRGGFMATGEAKIIDNAIMGFMQASDLAAARPSET